MAIADFLHNLQHAPGDVVDLRLSALVGVAHAGRDVPRHHRRRHLQTSGAAHSISNVCATTTTSERESNTNSQREVKPRRLCVYYFFGRGTFYDVFEFNPLCDFTQLRQKFRGRFSSKIIWRERVADVENVNYENCFTRTSAQWLKLPLTFGCFCYFMN